MAWRGLLRWLERRPLFSGRRHGAGHLLAQQELRVKTWRPRLETLEDRIVPSFVSPAYFYAGGDNGTGINLTGISPQMAVGDFNNDDSLDVVAEDYQRDKLYVSLGNGDSTFHSPLVNQNLPRLNELSTGDFNHDGNLDVAALDDSNGGIAILLGNGDGKFQAPLHAGWNQSYAIDSFVVGDFNGDGRLDLALGSNTNNTVHVGVLLGNGDGTFRSAVITDIP